MDVNGHTSDVNSPFQTHPFFFNYSEMGMCIRCVAIPREHDDHQGELRRVELYQYRSLLDKAKSHRFGLISWRIQIYWWWYCGESFPSWAILKPHLIQWFPTCSNQRDFFSHGISPALACQQFRSHAPLHQLSLKLRDWKAWCPIQLRRFC